MNEEYDATISIKFEKGDGYKLYSFKFSVFVDGLSGCVSYFLICHKYINDDSIKKHKKEKYKENVDMLNNLRKIKNLDYVMSFEKNVRYIDIRNMNIKPKDINMGDFL